MQEQILVAGKSREGMLAYALLVVTKLTFGSRITKREMEERYQYLPCLP